MASRSIDLILEKLIDLKADGSFGLDLSYFNYCTGLTMTNERSRRYSASRCVPLMNLLYRVPHGCGGLHSGGSGRSRAPPHAQPCEEDRCEELVSRGRRRTQLRRERRTCCAMERSKNSGSNRRQAMPAGPWARRLPPSTSSTASRATPSVATACFGSFLGPSFSRRISNDGSWQLARVSRR